MIIGKRIIRRQKVDSTNLLARQLIAEGAGEGLVVVAAEQFAGRGQRQNQWFSPRGNIYCSIVVKPFKNPRDLGGMTLMAAQAASRAIVQQTALPVEIK